MKYLEFKNSLDKGLNSCIFLLEGEDAYFREKGLSLLKNKYVSEPTLNYVCFEGSGLNVKELYASLTAYPFMSEKRLTAVREFYPDKNALKGELKDYLDNPSSDSLLVILNEKPCDALKKFGGVTVVECGKADVSLLVKWMRGECAKYNVVVESEAAQKIAEYCLSDMTRIENETHKLACYVGSGGVVKTADVDALVARDTEYKIYEMTDYIGKRKFDMALSVVKDMLSKGETPQRLLSSIYNYFRRLLHVSISSLTDAEMATMLGIKEFAVKKAKDQAKQFKVRSLKNAVDRIADCDYNIKSGNIDAFEGLWLSVFSIMVD